MNLLSGPEHEGYPVEYLTARIRARRAGIARDWDRVLFNPEVQAGSGPGDKPFTRMFSEYQWVYAQMPHGVRNVFYPFFLSQETRTVITCLRLRQRKGSASEIDAILLMSLLADHVQKAIAGSPDLPGALHELGLTFAHITSPPPELQDIFFSQGLQAVEVRLEEILFRHCLESAAHPGMKEYLACLADMKNVILLWKHLRWSLDAPLELFQGGSIPASRLISIKKSGELSGIDELVQELTGAHHAAAAESCLESMLDTEMLRRLARRSRTGDDTALILHYLWVVSMETHNLNMLHWTRHSDRETVRKELVIA